MTTLAEIAKKAGVSTHTASRVLNGGFEGIYPKAIRRAERIREMAEQLGYRPNAAAQAVCSGRFGVLGMLLSGSPHYSYLPHQLLRGLQDATESRGEQLALGRVPDDELSREGWLPGILRRWSVDGLLINYHYHLPSGMAAQIRRHQIPAVWINADQPADCVRPDDFDAGRQLTEHLLERGRRRIAYVDRSHGSADLADEHYSAVERSAGYECAMKAAGLEPRTIRPVHKLGHPDSLEHARSLVSGEQRPDAVVTFGGAHAEIFTVAAALEGLACGGDLEIATFNATALEARFGYAPITMIEPNAELGRAAVEQLHRKISAPGEPLPVVRVPFRLASADRDTDSAERPSDARRRSTDGRRDR